MALDSNDSIIFLVRPRYLAEQDEIVMRGMFVKYNGSERWHSGNMNIGARLGAYSFFERVLCRGYSQG